MYPLIFSLVILFSTLSLKADETPLPVVKKHIEKLMSDHEVPGVAIALVYKGKSYLYQFGYADKHLQKLVTSNTIFELASITKVFTSTALAMEVLNGKMALTDSVAKYIPQLKQNKYPIDQVRLLDLATHTSSLPRGIPNHKKKETEQHRFIFLRNWKPSYPIGTKYSYSNFGFALLGFAIENIEHESYEQVIAKFITDPLQMTSTFVHVPYSHVNEYAQGYTKNGKMAKRYKSPLWPGGGALRSSSSDMLKFLEANLELAGPKELQNAMQLAQKGYFKVKHNFEMGLGWQRYTSPQQILIIDKNGGLEGFSTYIGMVPDEKLGIVILANKAKAHSTNVGRKILINLIFNKKN